MDFETLATLSEEDMSRIRELNETLGVDSNSRITEIRNTIDRIRKLLSNIKLVEESLSSSSIEDARLQLQEVVTKKATAKVSAEQAFTRQNLSGVGEEVWQELWESARKYSQESAYPDRDFPFVEEGAFCVLCQQELNPDARNRLSDFECFVKDDTQQQLKDSEFKLNGLLNALRNLTVGCSAFVDHLSAIPDSRKELKALIRRFHRVAWKIRRRILQSCSSGKWVHPCKLTDSPAPNLEELILVMSNRIQELEQAADDDKRKILIQEQKELMARHWLGKALDDVAAEINRLKKVKDLEYAKGDTATAGITRKNGKLTDLYVTDALSKKMIEEIQVLGAKHLHVELVPVGGQYGQKRFQIRLQNASANIKISKVLSEGEFRIIALAGFFAELSTEESGSSLIFDDPVSSLDHLWRRKVAERLSQEAEHRQVIVFTHDAVFLHDLLSSFAGVGSPQVLHLQTRQVGAGVCEDGEPWITMPVSKRVGVLKNKHQCAKAVYNNKEYELYDSMTKGLYGLLREAWERAIEELLLNGAIVRFGLSIQTQRLKKVTDINDGDLTTINNAMSKTSRFLQGHDQAAAINEPPPAPDEVADDIKELEDWVKAMKKRRN